MCLCVYRAGNLDLITGDHQDVLCDVCRTVFKLSVYENYTSPSLSLPFVDAGMFVPKAAQKQWQWTHASSLLETYNRKESWQRRQNGPKRGFISSSQRETTTVQLVPSVKWWFDALSRSATTSQPSCASIIESKYPLLLWQSRYTGRSSTFFLWLRKPK